MASKQEKFSILFLGTQMEVGGAQRVLLSQARWFHKQGCSVQAIFFYDKQGLAQTWQSQFDFPIFSVGAWVPGAFPLFNVFYLGRGLLRLFLLLRKRIKVIVTFTPHSNLLGLPLAWLAGVPVRVGTHHGYIEGSSNRLAWLHGRLTNSCICNAMVTVSTQVREFALNREGANDRKLIVIENGIGPLRLQQLEAEQRRALRKEIGASNGTVLLLTVGRLTQQKGHTILLDAIAKLKSESAQLVFVFAGDGPLRADLEQKANLLEIAQWVRFLGMRSDINELLLAADIFVQPSLWEGLSIALLEALQVGLPIVATKVEGVVDVVEDGSSALLVPPKDSDALAAALRRLLGDIGLRQRLGRVGQRRAQARYSVDHMCTAYQHLFATLLRK